MLSARRPCLAIDSRDKVFALLGFAKDVEGYLPDYSKSVTEVYTEIAEHVLAITANLEILREVKELPQAPNHPYWVPDWRINPKSPLLGYDWAGPSVFSASKSSPSRFGIYVADGKRILSVEGFHFDMSAHLPRVWQIHEKGWQPWVGLTSYPDGEWAKTALSVFSNGVYKPTGEPLIQAYYRVLAADQLFSSARLSSSVRRDLYPETSGFVDSSKADTLHHTYLVAFQEMKDNHLDFKSAVDKVASGPDICETAKIRTWLNSTERLEGKLYLL